MLKRKREGAEPLRKKVKTRRKSDAAQEKADEDVRMENIATPAKPKEVVTNSVPSTAATATPSVSRSAKKKARKLNAGNETPGQAGAASTPVSSAKKGKGGQPDAVKAAGPEPTPSKTATGKTQALVPHEPPNPPKPKGKSKEKKKSDRAWSWGALMGGWFLPEDPVFSSDEKHVILANARALQVYANDTSSLERALPMRSGYVSTYALSAANQSHVYTANAAGLITLWDWTEGKTVGRWDIGTNVRSITVVADPASNTDLVYSHEMGSSHIVNVHALRTRQEETELKEIFKTKSPITGMRILAEGKLVVIAHQKSIVIGKRTKSASAALRDVKYVWREFQMSRRITSFDAYVRGAGDSVHGDKGSAASGDHIDLAVGDQDGVVWLFEDILASLIKVEKAHKDASKTDTSQELLRPKRLHWHREAVASVKWSRDGEFYCPLSRLQIGRAHV